MREKPLNLSLFLFYLNFGNGCSRQASPSGQPAIREGAMNERPANTFQRKAFTISRLAEFVSESRFVDEAEGGR